MKQIKIACQGAGTLELEQIEPFQGNLKDLSKENYDKLRTQILELGFSEPMTVWKSPDGTYKAINCHQRIRVLTELKRSEGYVIPPIPVSYLEADSEHEAKKKILALTSQFGEITKQGLFEFASLNNIDLPTLESFRFPEINMDFFKAEFFEDPVVGECDEDEIPEVVEPRTKLGDLIIMGDHRLLCGNSTNIEHVERLMDGNKADMVFTDPPYNQETQGGINGAVGSALKKQSSEIEHLCDFDPQAFLQTILLVFAKSTMNAMIFCNKDLVVEYLKWARDCGFAYNILVWKKPNAIPLGGSYRPDLEYLLTFRKSAIWNAGLEAASYSKLLVFDREQNKVHPTMKPTALIENQIVIGSNKNGILVDLFGGSGSTLIACEKTNRKCFMMELDPKYCDVIIARWEMFTGKTAVLETSGEIVTG